jgi:hypothetical protein
VAVEFAKEEAEAFGDDPAEEALEAIKQETAGGNTVTAEEAAAGGEVGVSLSTGVGQASVTVDKATLMATTPEEFFNAIGGEKMVEELAAEAFAKYDKDGNAVLDVTEFTAWAAKTVVFKSIADVLG